MQSRRFNEVETEILARALDLAAEHDLGVAHHLEHATACNPVRDRMVEQYTIRAAVAVELAATIRASVETIATLEGQKLPGTAATQALAAPAIEPTTSACLLCGAPRDGIYERSMGLYCRVSVSGMHQFNALSTT